MIVPRSRLLFWFAVVVLPFSCLGAVAPATTALSVAAIGLFGLVALADALGARTGLRGIGVDLPPVSRMSKDREAKLDLRIHNQHQRPKVLRLGLVLPREFESPADETLVALPANSEWSRLTWSCRPRRRGRFRLETACLEAGSPLGLWATRKSVPARSELRVYPNLFAERRNLAALFLRRDSYGLHAQRQVGKGRDFEKLRDYSPGDSFDEIHWKATARRGHPITKVFQIERTQEVYVVIDASRLSTRPVEERLTSPLSPSDSAGENDAPDTPSRASHHASLVTGHPPDTTVLERFITASLLLGLAAEQQGDLFGLLTFTNKVETFVRARNGKAHYSACRDSLYTLQPQIVTPDYDEVCTFIRLRLRRRALLVVLTSLDDPVLAESFVRNMDLIRRQHLVLVNMLQPPGVAPVFSDQNVAEVDDLYRQLGGHLLWQKLRELGKVLQRRGVRFSLLKNERLSTELVSQYLTVKQRQLL